MRAFTVYWDPDTDATEIKYSESFTDAYSVAKIDIMIDVISELDGNIDKLMSANHNRWEKSYGSLYKANKIAERNGEKL